MIIWSIISGIASIISFLIAINKRFIEWNKYLWYVGCTFVGISIGLLLSSFEKIAINFNTESSLQFLFLFGTIIVLGIIVYLLIKKGQDLLGYSVFLIFLILGLPKFKEIIKDNRTVNKQELMILAKYYEENQMYDKAIHFWEIYKKESDIIKSDTLCKKIDSKIEKLKIKQLE